MIYYVIQVHARFVEKEPMYINLKYIIVRLVIFLYMMMFVQYAIIKENI